MLRERLQTLCERNHMTIGGLETALGYSNGALRKSDNIKSERLAEIANYFGVTTDYLLGLESKMELAFMLPAEGITLDVKNGERSNEHLAKYAELIANYEKSSADTQRAVNAILGVKHED